MRLISINRNRGPVANLFQPGSVAIPARLANEGSEFRGELADEYLQSRDKPLPVRGDESFDLIRFGPCSLSEATDTQPQLFPS